MLAITHPEKKKSQWSISVPLDKRNFWCSMEQGKCQFSAAAVKWKPDSCSADALWSYKQCSRQQDMLAAAATAEKGCLHNSNRSPNLIISLLYTAVTITVCQGQCDPVFSQALFWNQGRHFCPGVLSLEAGSSVMWGMYVGAQQWLWARPYLALLDLNGGGVFRSFGSPCG